MNKELKKDKKKVKKSKSVIKKIILVILFIVTLPVTLFFIFWLGFKLYDLLFNWDLRAKKSYSREITINFEYEGKDYTMKPVVTCINKGTKINEGSMEWYTDWDYQIKNQFLNLMDKKIYEFGFTYLCKHCLNGNLIEKIFQKKIVGHTNILCDIVLDSNKSKIDIFIKESTKPKIFSKEGNYYFSSFMYLTVNSKNRDKQQIERIKINSYQIGNKTLIDK